MREEGRAGGNKKRSEVEQRRAPLRKGWKVARSENEEEGKNGRRRNGGELWRVKKRWGGRGRGERNMKEVRDRGSMEGYGKKR